MRRLLSALFAFALVVTAVLPAFADKPWIPCTISACCRQPCGTWCVDFNGNYQSCQFFVGACDGACDLSRGTVSDAESLSGETAAEPLPFLLDPVAEPLFTPVPEGGACAANAA